MVEKGVAIYQDKFDHDKGQKSAISGRRLQWIFCFFSSIYVQFSKTSPLKSGESSENPVEQIASNPVTSVAVMVFLALNICRRPLQMGPFQGTFAGARYMPMPSPNGSLMATLRATAEKEAKVSRGHSLWSSMRKLCAGVL